MEIGKVTVPEFESLVLKERITQEAKWGVQNHNPERWLAILVEEVGEFAKAINQCENYWDARLAGNYCDEDIKKELIQVAAVCRAMWESGKRCGWL